MSENYKIVPVILAGGRGARLWPLSKKSHPKQFLKLITKHSLFQETLLRANAIDGVQQLVVVTNELYCFTSRDQIAELELENVSILLEPCSRNTAPAIALAAHYICDYLGENNFMLVLPSDHFIRDGQNERSFNAILKAAIQSEERNFLLAFGVTPTAPKTGYGYIRIGESINSLMFDIRSFIEKPNLKEAKAFIKKKEFYWNSGIFLFRPQVYLEELRKYAYTIFQVVMETYRASEKKEDYVRIDQHSFLKCPCKSIDYAIMEKTGRAAMVPLQLFWSDLGCWASVADTANLDEEKNSSHGKVLMKNCGGCFVYSEGGKLVVTIGVENLVVVETEDAILVVDKTHAQQVKEVEEDYSIEFHL